VGTSLTKSVGFPSMKLYFGHYHEILLLAPDVGVPEDVAHLYFQQLVAGMVRARASIFDLSSSPSTAIYT
jgi:hypothetical protein